MKSIVESTIRKGTRDDLDQLSALFDQYRVFYKYESNPSAAYAFLSERMNRNESEIFVADVGHRLAGFVQLYPVFSSTRMKRLWLLNDLFVNPDFRGQHISVALIDRAKLFAGDTNAIGLVLETAKSNVIGNALYPKAGFTLDSDHNYYSWDVV